VAQTESHFCLCIGRIPNRLGLIGAMVLLGRSLSARSQRFSKSGEKGGAIAQVKILVHCVPSRAQLKGPEPGLQDPVGSASNYQSLRGDDLTLIHIDAGRIFTDYTYRIDENNRVFGLLNTPRENDPARCIGRTGWRPGPVAGASLRQPAHVSRSFECPRHLRPDRRNNAPSIA
jgi:hypothetical protein